MTIRVALSHITSYDYSDLVNLGPQVIRLRPAPHCRTPVHDFSLKVFPKDHFLNWQQDPYGNFLARLVFPKETKEFRLEVGLVADMTVINPFDFFLEAYAERFPFAYEPWLATDLQPFLMCSPPGPKLAALLKEGQLRDIGTNDFLVAINQLVQSKVAYTIRMEPGVQEPEYTLELGSGSCRDSAWLLVQLFRQLGIAARFVSGYLIQLAPDVKSLDGPSGTEVDFTDLHAWCEVYLPGAGWVGLDPTSGLLCGEGHIPLACTPDPATAAPITGALGPALGVTGEVKSEFNFKMTVSRIHEDPRVTKPYTDEQWLAINQLGQHVDHFLKDNDVRLTMGGEPTFVSIDDMEGEEWNTAATGPTKRQRADVLIRRLRDRYAPGGLLHYGQGKWYPGESLPRWAFTLLWRKDGAPVWSNHRLLSDENTTYNFTVANAEQFALTLAERLELDPRYISKAFEDVAYYVLREQRLPINEDVINPKLKDPEERARLARVFQRGLDQPTGVVIPVRRQWWQSQVKWTSGPWPVRRDQLYLLPGDSPMGFRLPLDSLPYLTGSSTQFSELYTVDPTIERAALPKFDRKTKQASIAGLPGPVEQRYSDVGGGYRTGQQLEPSKDPKKPQPKPLEIKHPKADSPQYGPVPVNTAYVRTAMTIEPRDGRLFIFMPPTESAEDYLDLIAAIEATAEELNMPIAIEGYMPPPDYRLDQFKVTPDPGVIEVNIPPVKSWDEAVELTTTLYEEARLSRLGTEKFMLDGRHSGTGGGNHVVLGGISPSDSPFLRRPDLLRSLVAFWINHPSLSYLFSGMFIGPTSQAPRVDEGRRDSLYELQIAFQQVPPFGQCAPWLVDRIFRNLLVDLTGNTHRAEICIDKLYSPDSSSGRLGLVELRGFEMPPHAQMSLTQQLLVRSLIAWFWREPYGERLVSWGTSLHDRFMLPYYLQSDMKTVIKELNRAGYGVEWEWFRPHFEFRCPMIGEFSKDGMSIELRTALEPWYVLGEEPAGGGTTRYVDSSVERLQVKVTGMPPGRYVITCNGRRVPLQATGTEGEYVAGIRYRAWQPPSCLHPTIGVHTPLVFDLVDLWLKQSLGGCMYHVAHPGGRNYVTFPINALEAESRRAGRFFKMGHSIGQMPIQQEEVPPEYPFTLDLRRISSAV
jgi:uncharacterized protein (DUF2126 family)/transglutaminase-like putative cysteine protease